MKKFFSFAAALLACVLTFTSCEKNIDSPIVGKWNASLVIKTDDGEFSGMRIFSFYPSGSFHYADYFISSDGVMRDAINATEGTYKLDGDKVTLHFKNFGTIKNGEPTWDKDFKPYDELAKWRVEGAYLYLTRNAGTAEEHEEKFHNAFSGN